MRLLHTSDLHLGATLHQASRHEEQVRMLAWLREAVVEHDVDVLLVAGDVFDHYQPSAEALSVWYGFLAGLASDGHVRRVIVVGGNHDSAARLDAPSEVLGALRVHVVGGYDASREPDLVVGIEGGEGDVALAVCAVPFVHEFRLGVRAVGAEPGALAADIRERFAALYTRLADAARDRFGDVPLVATGHMTVAAAREDVDENDFGTPLHQVGTIGALPPAVFDPRYVYVALGHLHRMHPADGGQKRVWYSGTPVALNPVEARTGRRVIVVDVDTDGATSVQAIPVPLARRMVHLDGPLAEVEAAIDGLTWDEPLGPYVLVTVRTDEPGANPATALQSRCPEGAVLVHVEQRRATPVADAAPLEARPLRELSTEDVFADLVRRREGDAPSDALWIAFRSLLSDADDPDEADTSSVVSADPADGDTTTTEAP